MRAFLLHFLSPIEQVGETHDAADATHRLEIKLLLSQSSLSIDHLLNEFVGTQSVVVEILVEIDVV